MIERSRIAIGILGLSLLVPTGLTRAEDAGEDRVKAIRAATSAIDDTRLRRAHEDVDNWLSYGRTYSEQRFSPLDEIHAENVDQLELLWTFDLGTRRGLEATPIVVDGSMYVTGSWSIVFALDAKTGEELWRWDPGVDRQTAGQRACCDVVNRGVAVYDGKIYVGVLDGRLAALDAATGELVWETMTVDPKKPYTITAAPHVVNGKVIIGNGGAEFAVRGYVSAYDAQTGELVWRTYTVPGDPSEPFESEAMERAAETWPEGSEEWLARGAGGTVWDTMAFDPDLNLLYMGTGNGTAWPQAIRSPKGGDNLYLASILALDADTGEQKWFYQQVPGDSWDYDAAQQIILADLEIDGKERKVLLHAPKNGFFYVLDRKTGELISAEKFVTVTWAERIDLETGRPVVVDKADYREEMALVQPTPFGAHNWQSMSYNPGTGLVYIPAQEIVGAYALDPEYEFREGQWNVGTDGTLFTEFTRDMASGLLLAWDPVKQEEAWQVPLEIGWNGGTLTTAGNLVFQGTAKERFVAYRADDGNKLWEAPSPSGIIAAPVTYRVDGQQQVTILAGWGGAFAIAGGDAAAAAETQAGGMVLTYGLPREKPTAEAKPSPTPDPKLVAGERLFHTWCARCHGAAGISGGPIPDLRKSGLIGSETFIRITRDGMPNTGMAGFGDVVSAEEARLIQGYLQARRDRMDAQ